MSYNFDTVLLGLILGTAAVGWYNAAYKPVTVVLAMPTTYFIGLFPALSRAHTESQECFNDIATRSFRLASVYAVPLGIGSLFLAEPVIHFLFGAAYANAVPALQILGWSAVLVMLRGTFRQSLNAAGRSRLDLRCAVSAVTLNVGLNLLLIPRYGIVGAASATLVSEVVWFSMAYYYFNRHIVALRLMPLLLQPLAGAMVLSVSLLLSQPLFWGFRVMIGALVYFGTLWLLGEREVRALLKSIKSQLPTAEREPTMP